MPYESDKQRGFFEGCRHSPKHMKGKCPAEKTLEEFHDATYHAGDSPQKAAIKRKLQED